jgi:hypothetical protein
MYPNHTLVTRAATELADRHGLQVRQLAVSAGQLWLRAA